MFRDLKSELHIERHLLRTEESLAKRMLIVTLAYRVILEDGTQWRARLDLQKIQKSTPRGRLSIYRVASACFRLCLTEAPEEAASLIVNRWTNRRAA